MSTDKRRRQRANRLARIEAAQPVAPVTDAELDDLLTDVTVRTDCEHASTRTTPDGPVLIRCALDVAVAGGCPRECPSFERRRVDGVGLGGGA